MKYIQSKSNYTELTQKGLLYSILKTNLFLLNGTKVSFFSLVQKFCVGTCLETADLGPCLVWRCLKMFEVSPSALMLWVPTVSPLVSTNRTRLDLLRAIIDWIPKSTWAEDSDHPGTEADIKTCQN